MSKLRVNLFSEALLPPKLRLSFEHLMMTSAAIVVIAILLMMWSYWEFSQTQVALSQQQDKQLILSTNKEKLEQQLSLKVAGQALVAQVKRETEQLALKNELLIHLKQRQLQPDNQGFATALTDLAQVTTDAVWLSRIQMGNGHYQFDGFALQPKNVPQWIERLESTQAFSGQTFASMTMSRGKDQPLAFSLQSQIVTKEKAAGSNQ
ncbi:PilN domain-containing protein [Shewanella marina]|uniref:PilN domain-containing protein n=1 Tax=Shewanella marina TaxID=487319 RepID=UPI0004724F86|nr:PilN domain-containing protein [Shewanella marina]